MALVICVSLGAQAADYTLASPDGQTVINVQTGSETTWSITYAQKPVLSSSRLALETQDSKGRTSTLGQNTSKAKASRSSVNTTVASPFYHKASITDNYNELRLSLSGYDILFRAYDHAAAYRFVLKQKQSLTVNSEVAEFNFPTDAPAFVPYINDNRGGERYTFSFESFYDEVPLSQIYADSLIITPLSVEVTDGLRATIFDTSVRNYPGMFLTTQAAGSHALVGQFAPVVLEEEIGGHARLNLVPTKRADYIAKLSGAQSLPWRTVMVTDNDAQLVESDVAYLLSEPCALTDTEWIRPGKVAWDWWNALGLWGVDFEVGVNTATYEAYIDFASENGLEYIIVDEGWSSDEDLLAPVEGIDIAALVDYGKQKGVGVILWASWRNTIKNMETTFTHYAEMGVKGFKIDFFDRDDQTVNASEEEIARAAAQHHLLVDFHGARPTGIHRMYPNIVNYEGVKGLENCKWEPLTAEGTPLHNFPRYDVSIPFLRMLIGPLDYTPGAMDNASRYNFRAINDNPMSQGTRVHQMAMYTIYDAPLQMLADSPSKYRREQPCTDFIRLVPTTFDESQVVTASLGEHITLARRSGNTWFVGALTNWTARSLTIPLSFLTEGAEYTATIFADGVNAHRTAVDYVQSSQVVRSSDTLTIQLAPGGGWTARFDLVK